MLLITLLIACAPVNQDCSQCQKDLLSVQNEKNSLQDEISKLEQDIQDQVVTCNESIRLTPLSCKYDEDCVGVYCDCDCSPAIYKDTVNSASEEAWYQKQGCDKPSSCPETECVSINFNSVCVENSCVLVDERCSVIPSGDCDTDHQEAYYYEGGECKKHDGKSVCNGAPFIDLAECKTRCVEILT